MSRNMNIFTEASEMNYRELKVLQKQLAISFKFHHQASFKKLPLEMILEAAAQVWQSCHNNAEP
jgi:hypothetical protein